MIRTVHPPATAHPPLLRSPGVAAGLPVAGATPTTAQEAARVRRATQLREAPSDEGRSVAALAAESSVTRLPQRQGAWVQVRTEGGATGWVHQFDLGPAARAASTASLTTSALHGIAGRVGPAPSTAGAAGEELNPSDRTAATPVENLRLTEAQAREYARTAQWEARPGEPLAADPSRLQPR